MVAIVEEFRPILIAVTLVFLGGAFYFNYRPQAHRSKSSNGQPTVKSRLMGANRIMLWVVTLFVAVFLFFPQTFTQLWASSGSEVTAEMEQTVIAIEGMT